MPGGRQDVPPASDNDVSPVQCRRRGLTQPTGAAVPGRAMVRRALLRRRWSRRTRSARRSPGAQQRGAITADADSADVAQLLVAQIEGVLSLALRSGGVLQHELADGRECRLDVLGGAASDGV